MSEIRKALELMKRVDRIEDAPAKRLALELGALACDRGSRGMAAARRAEDSMATSSYDSPGILLSVRGGAAHGGGDGGGSGLVSCTVGGKEQLGVGVRDKSSQLFSAPSQGAGESVALSL